MFVLAEKPGGEGAIKTPTSPHLLWWEEIVGADSWI